MLLLQRSLTNQHFGLHQWTRVEGLTVIPRPTSNFRKGDPRRLAVSSATSRHFCNPNAYYAPTVGTRETTMTQELVYVLPHHSRLFAEEFLEIWFSRRVIFIVNRVYSMHC